MNKLRKAIKKILDKYETFSNKQCLQQNTSPLDAEFWELLYEAEELLNTLEKNLKDPTMQATGDNAQGYRTALNDLKKALG